MKIEVNTPQGKELHCILKGPVACLLPVFGETEWEVNFYLHSEITERLQTSGCKILRFKDGGGIAEVLLTRALFGGWLTNRSGWCIINIPKKWAKIKQLQLL